MLVNRDQLKNCSLLAVDLRTGKKAWEAARPDVTQSFGTPILWKNGGADEVVMSGSLKLKGYDESVRAVVVVPNRARSAATSSGRNTACG